MNNIIQLIGQKVKDTIEEIVSIFCRENIFIISPCLMKCVIASF